MGNAPGHIWIEPLSPREVEILRLIQQGLANQEISQSLFLSLNTVKWYNKQIFAKLGAANRTEAVNKAVAHGFLTAASAAPRPQTEPATANFPAQITAFIGREREIGEIKSLLKTSRLVLLSGPGGSGKTRLALQVAGELQHAYLDGVALVEFAGLRQPDLAAQAICQALHLASSELAPGEALKRYLARKHLLLVLDNLEHLPGATPLVGEILAAAAQVSVLATSRECLHVYGEKEYPVHPLGLPSQFDLQSCERVLASEAVRLFIDRANLAGGDIDLDAAQIAAIGQICRRLDGLPLAIELAARQAKTIGLVLLAQRLEQDLDVLPPGPRNLPERQRTLRATIQWSYQLLQDAEKLLFARLAVFHGGSALPDIEAVCSAGLPGKSLHHLISLVEKNMLSVRQDQAGESRFVMLETLHEFAADCLAASGEAAQFQRQHAEYFTRIAEAAAQEMRSARQVYWFTRLRTEQDNLRAVLDWSLKGGDPVYGLRLVAALRDDWFYTGSFIEGQYWSQLALKKMTLASPTLQANVFNCAGSIAWSINNLQAAEVYYNQALQLYRQEGDLRQEAWMLIFVPLARMNTPGQLQAGLADCTQALQMLTRLEDKTGMAFALTVMGELARLMGDDEPAKGYYERALVLAEETGDLLRQAFLSTDLSFIAFHRGDFEQAIQLTRQAITVLQVLKVDYPLATHLGCLAGPIAASGAPKTAATLLGAADKLLEDMGADYQAGDQPDIQRVKAMVRQQLQPDEFQSAWQTGQAMSLAQAVAYALDGGDATPVTAHHANLR